MNTIKLIRAKKKIISDDRHFHSPQIFRYKSPPIPILYYIQFTIARMNTTNKN